MKKVLFVGFYDDYARFYSSVSNELAHLIDIESTFWYFNLSGYLYGKVHKQNCHLINIKSSINKHDSISTEIDYDSYLKYNSSCEVLTPILEEKLIRKASNYYSYISSVFESQKFDLIVMPGDCRMLERIIIDLAKINSIETVYFEQGPYGTTIIDGQGVNSYCSFRSDFNISNDSCSKKFSKPKKNKKFRRNPIYRGLDKIIDKSFRLHERYPYENREYSLNKVISVKEYEEIKEVSKDCEYILLILQVPHDANFTHHNPNFSSHFEMLRTIHSNKPVKSKVLVREHPLYKMRYEKELYDFISCSDDVFLDKSTLVEDTFKKAEIVVVNNSTSGLDALSHYKKVIVLGDSYYDQAPCVFKVESLNNLDCFIENVINSKIDYELVDRYLNSLVYNYLLPGHYRDDALTVSKLVAKKLKIVLG